MCPTARKKDKVYTDLDEVQRTFFPREWEAELSPERLGRLWAQGSSNILRRALRLPPVEERA